MGMIDKERIAAVATLKALGYAFAPATGWSLPDGQRIGCMRESDAMHAVLMRRADALQGCTDGSAEESELKAIADVLEAYEARRWPEGKEPGGKG